MHRTQPTNGTKRKSKQSMTDCTMPRIKENQSTQFPCPQKRRLIWPSLSAHKINGYCSIRRRQRISRSDCWDAHAHLDFRCSHMAKGYFSRCVSYSTGLLIHPCYCTQSLRTKYRCPNELIGLSLALLLLICRRLVFIPTLYDERAVSPA